MKRIRGAGFDSLMGSVIGICCGVIMIVFAFWPQFDVVLLVMGIMALTAGGAMLYTAFSYEQSLEPGVDVIDERSKQLQTESKAKAFDLMCRLIYYVNIILAFIYRRFDDRLEPLAWVCIGSMSVLIIAMIAQTAYINILDKYGSDGKPRKTRKIRIRKMSAVIRGGCLTAAILGGAITFYQSLTLNISYIIILLICLAAAIGLIISGLDFRGEDKGDE